MPDSRFWPGRSAPPLCGRCSCESRSIPDDGEGVEAARAAYPRAQYGASRASCLDGGLATIASNTSPAISLASSTPTSSASEESKDVRRPYATCARYGFASFGRANTRVVRDLTCSRAMSPGTSILRSTGRWMGVSGSPLCASSTAHAHSPTRTRHGCACSGGG
jgi:hypothetical protein